MKSETTRRDKPLQLEMVQKIFFSGRVHFFSELEIEADLSRFARA